MEAIQKNAILPGQMISAAAKPKAPEEVAPKVDTEDSFVGGVMKEAKEMAHKDGEITSSALGGAIGLAGLTAGLYAGVVGGAVFLGALGGGLGPVIAAVTTKGMLGFLAGTFKTVGFFAKAGIVLGGISTGVGGFVLAKNVGDIVGAIPGMMIGGAVGLVTGTVHQIQKKLGGGEE